VTHCMYENIDREKKTLYILIYNEQKSEKGFHLSLF
jgi:hypothetical protein